MTARETLTHIEATLAARCDAKALAISLRSPEWRLVLAALHALRLQPQVELASDVLRVLAREDQSDIYGHSGEEFGWGAGYPIAYFPDSLRAVPETTRELWKCRWRVKQAACLALGAMKAPGAVPALCAYAISQREDYQVRAAACRALGEISDAAAIATLQQAAHDEEWCTRTEANKALASIYRKAG